MKSVINQSGDTIEVVRTFGQEEVKEITFYRQNRPDRNIAIFANDTFTKPTAILIDGQRSLFVYVPINTYKTVDLDFEDDSVKLVYGQPGRIRINNLNESKVLKVDANMFVPTDKNLLKGSLTCRHFDGLTSYFLFQERTN